MNDVHRKRADGWCCGFCQPERVPATPVAVAVVVGVPIVVVIEIDGHFVLHLLLFVVVVVLTDATDTTQCNVGRSQSSVLDGQQHSGARHTHALARKVRPHQENTQIAHTNTQLTHTAHKAHT